MKVSESYISRMLKKRSDDFDWPVYPVYSHGAEKSCIDESFQIMLDVSREIWHKHGKGIGYLKPWHDEYQTVDAMKSADWYLDAAKFLKFFKKFEISLKSYCYFVCFYSDYMRWETFDSLYLREDCRSWTRKLYKYVDCSNEALHGVVSFLVHYTNHDIEKCHTGAVIKPSILVETDVSGRGERFGLYQRIADRMHYFEKEDIDYRIWMEQKFTQILESFEDTKYVHLKAVVNRNSFDPSFADIAEMVNDEWREVKEFLGLPIKCDFTDEVIPFGWQPATDDQDDKKKIVSVDKDGYYYYDDGTQRRGTRHYFRNIHYNIGCKPENFKKLKDRWYKKSLVMSTPTWEEYSKYAVYPGIWDEEGNSINGRGKAIKWRTR